MVNFGGPTCSMFKLFVQADRLTTPEQDGKGFDNRLIKVNRAPDPKFYLADGRSGASDGFWR